MRILVIEDNPIHATAAIHQLANEHDLTVVTNFDEAREALQPVDIRECGRELEELHPGWKIEKWNHYDSSPMLRSPEGKRIDPFDEEFGVIVDPILQKHRRFPFEVVLTDVMLPKGGNVMMSEKGRERARADGTTSYGPVIVLRALMLGAKYVGMLTEGNHHDDPVVWAIEGLNFAAGNAKVEARFTDPRYSRGEPKDWAGLLAALLSDERSA